MEVRKLACENCGTPFTCGEGGANGGCWCMDLPPELALPGKSGGVNGASDCLCPDCMQEQLRERANSRPESAGN